MKCIYTEKECRFRNKKTQQCHWSCEDDLAGGDCEIAILDWGCPYCCIYEALKEDSACPLKEMLRKELNGTWDRRIPRVRAEKV